MVHFSCFYPQIPSHKPKKAAQPSFEAKLKMLKCGSESHASANVIDPMSLNKAPLIQKADDGERNETEHIVLASRVWRSGEFNSEFRAENEKDIHKMGNLRKTRSLGCKLDDLHRRILDENNTGDCDQSHDCNEGPELSPPLDPRSSGSNMSIREQEVVQSESPHQSFDQVNHESIVTISDPHSLEKQGHEDSDAFLYAMSAGDFGEHINRSPVLISRSCSVPNFGSSSTTSGERSSCRSSPPRNKFEDLNALRCKGKEILFSDDHTQLPGNTINDNLNKSMEKGEMAVHDGYDFYKYAVPVSEEVDFVKNHPGESSSHQGDQFPSKDFKKKRIEEWVNDLQHCSPLEQTDEVFDSGEEVKKSSPVLDGLDLTKSGAKINSGMEAAKRYISSLNAAATSVQLVNHGLVVIPFLRSFFSLKVLNLSGNSIARITAGALPRGLHMLNLSRNKISTIEGLRELTRLRVLDLSCNKISRIGHGLAHCSSLKELYLAGNKISEVEGLHRLLKLTVLDLRFNKIATSKCLGQLAANYNSLQAINLEGNPAQKNVGDEQLKKYLQGLLPHLAYYNRQSIKTSTLKDSAERAVRLGSAHQFDRGLRSDHKSGRWASHGAVSLRQSAHKGQGSELGKRSKGRHGHLPPSATRVSNHPNHRHHQLEIGNKVLGLRSELSIPKSRSVGTLAAL